MAASLAVQPASIRPRTRRWRSVLAALISLALVLSFFDCCCLDGDEGTLIVSVAQTSCDISGKTPPASPAPHCCYCLSHVATAAPQDSAVAIEYVTGVWRLAVVPLPDAADLSSPFEPPRA